MKKYLSDFGSYLMIYVASLGIGLLVYIIALYPFKIILSPTAMMERILRFALGASGTAAGFFALSYPKGYKRAEFQWKSILIPILLVFIIQQIIAPIFEYVPYVAGTSRELADIIYMIQGHGVAELEYVPNWLRHICMLMFDVILIIPPVFLGQYVGSKKRQKERKMLGTNQGDK